MFTSCQTMSGLWQQSTFVVATTVCVLAITEEKDETCVKVSLLLNFYWLSIQGDNLCSPETPMNSGTNSDCDYAPAISSYLCGPCAALVTHPQRSRRTTTTTSTFTGYIIANRCPNPPASWPHACLMHCPAFMARCKHCA